MAELIDKIKESWNKLEFWQKGVIVGFLFYLVYSLVLWKFFHDPAKIASLGNIFFTAFNLKASFSVSAIASFIIVSFAIFGIGYKLADYIGNPKSYTLKGLIIGFWFLIVPFILVFLTLFKRAPYGEQTDVLILPIIFIGIFVLAGIGALFGYVYGKIKGAVPIK